VRVERGVTVSRGRFVAALVPVWLAPHIYELVWWREASAESRSVLAAS
jgi:hypothetical protein